MADGDGHERMLTTTHLVKGEDLNHHRTLYGGRCVEWCVHAAYITAENCFDENRPLVFMSIRNLSMRAPARLGDIVQLTGRVDYIGESTIGIRVEGRKLHPKNAPESVVTGSFLFCTVDEAGKALPHGLAQLAPRSAVAESHWKQAAEDAVRSLG